MEKTYTKEQLIAAQAIYNQNYKDNPEMFGLKSDIIADDAREQIEYLLSLVDE